MKTETKVKKDEKVEYFYKERPYGKELIAIDNGESRMAMREWDCQYIIDLKNMATGESLQFVLKAQELDGKQTISYKEMQDAYQYRKYAVETIMHIFWDMRSLEPLENKIAQLRKVCHHIDLFMIEISYQTVDFKKTILFSEGNIKNNAILRRSFQVGEHKSNLSISILHD